MHTSLHLTSLQGMINVDENQDSDERPNQLDFIFLLKQMFETQHTKFEKIANREFKKQVRRQNKGSAAWLTAVVCATFTLETVFNHVRGWEPISSIVLRVFFAPLLVALLAALRFRKALKRPSLFLATFACLSLQTLHDYFMLAQYEHAVFVLAEQVVYYSWVINLQTVTILLQLFIFVVQAICFLTVYTATDSPFASYVAYFVLITFMELLFSTDILLSHV